MLKHSLLYQFRPSASCEELTEAIYGQAEGVFAMVTHMVADPRDAEELTQDSLLDALHYVRRFDESQGTVAAWVRRIAYNNAVSFLRKRRIKTVSIEDCSEWEEAAADGEPPDSDTQLADSEERILRLEELLKALPPQERMLINLRYLEGRPLEEIAFIVNSNAKAVASHLNRIRNKLRKKMRKV